MYEEVRLTVPRQEMVNRHRVPKRQWRKWNGVARKIFNEVYGTMTQNQWAFLAPSVEKNPPTKRAWKTTAWNAAWIAADAVRH